MFEVLDAAQPFVPHALHTGFVARCMLPAPVGLQVARALNIPRAAPAKLGSSAARLVEVARYGAPFVFFRGGHAHALLGRRRLVGLRFRRVYVGLVVRLTLRSLRLAVIHLNAHPLLADQICSSGAHFGTQLGGTRDSHRCTGLPRLISAHHRLGCAVFLLGAWAREAEWPEAAACLALHLLLAGSEQAERAIASTRQADCRHRGRQEAQRHEHDAAGAAGRLPFSDSSPEYKVSITPSYRLSGVAGYLTHVYNCSTNHHPQTCNLRDNSHRRLWCPPLLRDSGWQLQAALRPGTTALEPPLQAPGAHVLAELLEVLVGDRPRALVHLDLHRRDLRAGAF
eukprot:scaffold128537_cov57-Phaeocystis_antarctica.AAC.1